MFRNSITVFLPQSSCTISRRNFLIFILKIIVLKIKLLVNFVLIFNLFFLPYSIIKSAVNEFQNL